MSICPPPLPQAGNKKKPFPIFIFQNLKFQGIPMAYWLGVGVGTFLGTIFKTNWTKVFLKVLGTWENNSIFFLSFVNFWRVSGPKSDRWPKLYEIVNNLKFSFSDVQWGLIWKLTC